jgi:hypothetical protein
MDKEKPEMKLEEIPEEFHYLISRHATLQEAYLSALNADVRTRTEEKFIDWLEKQVFKQTGWDS